MAEEHKLDVFQGNCLRTVLGTRLTDRILNGMLYEKCGSVYLSRALMSERLRRLEPVLWMEDCQKLSLSANRLGPNKKQVILDMVGR